MLKLIPYQNVENGKVFKKTLNELKKVISKHKNYKINYKNFTLRIMYNNYYCGFIDKYANKVKEYLNPFEVTQIVWNSGIYEVHDNFTDPSGVDSKHINDIFLESGSNLMNSFLKEKLIDELLLYISPKILGQDAVSFSGIKDIEKLSKKIQYTISDMIVINNDLKVKLENYNV